MTNAVTIVDAKAHFSELVDRAEAGDSVDIVRRGKTVARLTPAVRPRKPVDIVGLKAHIESMPWQAESSAAFVRRMRDDDRY